VPFLESNLLKVLRATGGARGGMTAEELSAIVFEPVGRVRMTLRRLHDRGGVQVTQGDGAHARYLPTGMRPSTEAPFSPPPSHNRQAELELQRLQAEVQQLRSDLTRARHDADAMRALLRQRPQGSLDPAHTLGPRVEELLQLCHPDRHDNSDKANEVTRWLLQLRKRR